MHTPTIHTLHKELQALQKEVNHLKKHMVDGDCVITDEEYDAHLKALEEHASGKTISLEDLEQEL